MRDVGLLFLDFFVLFKELVEQHRVDRIVAHLCNLAVLVAHHQIGIYLGHVFRNQTKLRRVFGFFGVSVLVMKRDRFERQDGFAGSASSMSKTAWRLRSWHSKRAGPPHPHLTANMVKLGQRRRFDHDAVLCGMVG